MKGYAGKILYIDLSNGTADSVPLKEQTALDYLGGMGINNYLAWKLIAPGLDPLAPENPIIIGSGGLGGTLAPASGKVMATTKLPANGTVGTCYAGGSLAPRLRWAGYDHVVISGRAPRPVYVEITSRGVNFVEATDLWGRDLLETTHELWRRLGEVAVLAIGPAGERQVKISFALVDNVGTLGRGGLGAVMGAKNLKAVTAGGDQGIEIAERKRFLDLTQQVNNALMGINWRRDWLRMGLYTGWPMWRELASRHNWQERYPVSQVERFGPQEYLKYYRYTLACPSCPMGDKSVVELDGPHGRSFYPICTGLHPALSGTRTDAAHEDEALRHYLEANRQGIDMLMAESLIDFAVDLFQHGVISTKETGGMVLDYGHATFAALLQQIAERQGLGEILGEGFAGAIAQLGGGAAQYAVCIKNMDPVVEPRPHTSGFTVAQMVSPRGPYAIAGNSPGFRRGRSAASFERFLLNIGAPAERATAIANDQGGVNVAAMLRYTEDWYAACSSLGICARQPVIQTYTPQVLAAIYAAATGTSFAATDLTTAGERIWNIYRMINDREGFSRPHDRLPEALFRPLADPEGPDIRLMDYDRRRDLTPEDTEKWLDDYYAERGWDKETGRPKPETLRRLGLDFMV